ncbi:MAG: ABC transporter permease [Chloroflexales bacterium]|nr:ABC transporter permease [Chloroflexales bacterium]
MVRRTIRTQEFALGLTVIALSLLISAINPVFFSVANLFDLLRSATVEMLFALGVLVVIASGGIDVSFTAVAIFALYASVRLLNGMDYDGGMALPYLLAASIGVALGLINGLFIALFKLPTLIVTLGTQSLFRGFLLFFIGAVIIRDIPDGMTEFARSSLLTITAPNGALVSLHVAAPLPLVAAIITGLLLKYTMLGRSIYALGGAPEAAERAGFNIRRTQLFIYAFVGLLSGIAGMTYGALNRQANPFDLVGTELDVIAAVVLGGAAITGGRGSVIGTLLGVMLIVIVNNSLILVGIPSVWQRVVIGAIIIIGTGVSAYQSRRLEQYMHSV